MNTEFYESIDGFVCTIDETTRILKVHIANQYSIESTFNVKILFFVESNKN